MDLYAYSQIEDLKYLLERMNIDIPRLRGLRLMKEEEAMSEEEIKEAIKIGLINWLDWNDNRGYKSALIYDKENIPVDADLSRLHGKKKKRARLEEKHITKRYRECMELFNRYVGQDILYVHARIGGGNRLYYTSYWKLIKTHPLYLADVDDCVDPTYCDIYFKLKVGEE